MLACERSRSVAQAAYARNIADVYLAIRDHDITQYARSLSRLLSL
jgi:hypothetical protein